MNQGERFIEKEVRALARQLTKERIAPSAADRDKTDAFPKEAIRIIGETGILGLVVAENLGGAGANRENLAAVITVLAKLFASETAVEVTNTAIQVLGGHGYCRDHTVERLFRDARGLTLHFKTSEWLRQDIAKAALGL
jgi:alkylation response protein AidB-like acyl-CoA dehydrogenase